MDMNFTSLDLEGLAIKLATGLAILIIGWIVVGLVLNGVAGSMRKRNADESLVKFLKSVLGIVLKVALLIAVAGQMGIETTSFMAVIGAMGLAIGLALQGSLANFAGGVMIIIFKPFKVGEVIDANGVVGGVHEIGMFATTLINAQKKTIILPNASLSNNTITNVSRQGILRADIAVGIAYDASIKEAKDILLETVLADSRVLKEHAPAVVVTDLGDSSVNLSVRAHTTTADYWDYLSDMTQKVKEALDSKGIEIPFPQTVMHQAKG